VRGNGIAPRRDPWTNSGSTGRRGLVAPGVTSLPVHKPIAPPPSALYHMETICIHRRAEARGWAATDNVRHVAVTPSWLVEYIKKRCKPAPHSSSSSLSIWDSRCKRQFLTKIAPWQVVVPLPVFLAWALVWPQCFEWRLNSLFLFWTSVWTI